MRDSNLEEKQHPVVRKIEVLVLQAGGRSGLMDRIHKASESPFPVWSTRHLTLAMLTNCRDRSEQNAGDIPKLLF